MTAVSARRIVAVGVDGSPEAVDAARYAVEAAHARHLDLLVVCAYQMPMSTDDLTAEPIRASRIAADKVVSDVVSQLTVPTTMKVSTLVQLTSPVTLLHRVAETAALVVIGSHHFNLTDQFLTGPVASPVAAHADCPVVVVPRAWSLTPVGIRPVVVALDGQTAATAALDFAFAEAELRTCGVTALHAAPLRDPTVMEQGRRAGIAEILAGHQEDHPDIAVRAQFIPGEPKDAIIDQSFSAAMMVVGRPHRRRLGSWTRSVAKAVLDQTHCPLVVVPRSAGPS
jgi:nucleotide-binding universal stress UspA family protein